MKFKTQLLQCKHIHKVTKVIQFEKESALSNPGIVVYIPTAMELPPSIAANKGLSSTLA